jgi:exodeoxyribonuclease VII small subunit
MKKKSYSEILKDLETLVEKMNRGDVPVDKLGESVKAASDMIKTLRHNLRATEAEIAEVMKSMDDGNTA